MRMSVTGLRIRTSEAFGSASLALLAVLAILLPATFTNGAFDSEFAPGDRVILVVRDNHIPGHPAVGDNSVSLRLRSGTQAQVLERGAGNKAHWYKVRGTDNDSGLEVETWIIAKYIEAGASSGVDNGGSSQSIVIGAWNLEHFAHSKSRGFPENTSGGPSFGPRDSSQVAQIASVITVDLSASLLMLSEINGQTEDDPETGETETWSAELEDLMGALGADWDYLIAESGGSQRVAMIWDTTRVSLQSSIELVFPFESVDGKDVFARDPLAAHVTLIDAGQPRNDLVVVGVHLASGQHRDDNHDRAMELLRGRLQEFQLSGLLGGQAENDILIMGDFNANAFRTPAEAFFIDMDEPDGRWDVLAEGDYPATRLSGNPLEPRNSQIDYIIATRGQGAKSGLSGEEITGESATVHLELAERMGFVEFREHLSDHLPVTVEIRVVNDSD